MKKTLYEYEKGKKMSAKGSWKTTKSEQKLINVVAVFFASSVIAVLITPFVQNRVFLTGAIVCCVISFISMFVVLFGLVYKKSREEPMEAHYYDVERTYNGITNTTDDRTREITRDEFLGSKEDKPEINS